jgi:ubiquitin carboxyl-terminal hydrolase 7
LQLNVRGCNNVYDSFIKYTEEEMMDGANQYNAEGHGLQVGGQNLGVCANPRG